MYEVIQMEEKCAYRYFLCLKSSLNMTKTLSGINVILLHFFFNINFLFCTQQMPTMCADKYMLLFMELVLFPSIFPFSMLLNISGISPT